MDYMTLKEAAEKWGVLFALGTRVDYRMYQTQLIRTLGAGWLHLVNQFFHIILHFVLDYENVMKFYIK